MRITAAQDIQVHPKGPAGIQPVFAVISQLYRQVATGTKPLKRNQILAIDDMGCGKSLSLLLHPRPGHRRPRPKGQRQQDDQQSGQTGQPTVLH